MGELFTGSSWHPRGAVAVVDAMILLVAALVLVFVIYSVCRIFKKSGFPAALGLIVLIPYLGALIAIGILAFANWPSQKKPQSPSV
jgi:hypothetical protein